MSTTTSKIMKKKLKKFSYQAISGRGEVKQGVVDAYDEQAVNDDLVDRGFSVLSVEEVANEGLNKELNFNIGGRVKLKDLAVFSRKMSTMVDAGIPLASALAIMVDQTTHANLKSTISDVHKEVIGGAKLGKSMGEFPDVFPDLMVNMIHAGESSGTLDDTFKQIATNFEADVRLRSRVKSAMTYPVVVFILAILLSTAMLLFIVPVFSGLFEDLGGDLPLPTKIMVALSNFLKYAIIPIAIAGVGAGFWWVKNKDKESIRQVVDPLKLRVPVFGLLHEKIVMSRFTRNLGNLLNSGVDIVKSIDIVADTVGSTVFSKAIHNVREEIKEGKKLSETMTQEEIFPRDSVQMIKVGEDAADIEGMLLKIADSYDEEVESITDSLTSLLEPLMIVFLGAIVGSMVIALYLPMFSIYDYIG